MKALVLISEKEGVQYQTNWEDPKVDGNALVRTKVLGAALNKRDVWITEGLYPGIRYPVILGSDAVVRYEDQRYLVNPNRAWGTDERVQSKNYHIMGLPENGSFAEYLAVPEDRLVPCPEHLSNEEAAALPLAGLTAYRALFTRAQCKAKERVLISGFGGGVASMAFLFARALDCDLFVTSSSQNKRDLAMEMGAKAAFDYTEERFGKKIYKEHGGVDLVIDGAAGAGFGELVEACRPAGRISVYGGTAGKAIMSPQKLFWKQLNIFGSTMGSDNDFMEMVKFTETHKIRPLVSSVHSISRGREAFNAMERQAQTGKIVLIPDD